MPSLCKGVDFFTTFTTINCQFNHTLQLQSCGQLLQDVPAGTCSQVLRTGRRLRTRRDQILFSRFINCSMDLTFFPMLFLFIILHYPVRLKSSRYSRAQYSHQEDNLVHHSPHITWPYQFVRLMINKYNQDSLTLQVDQREKTMH